MTERPILFCAPMARAILEGRKTQTRRVINGDWSRAGCAEWSVPQNCGPGCEHTGLDGFACFFEGTVCESPSVGSAKCPYGVRGDRLWVKETWRETGSGQTEDFSIPKIPVDVYYRADEGTQGPWRPSIFMPRWASRITLEVTEVRVQRVQEINLEDALAEGIEECPDPAKVYAALWDSLNAKRGYSWESNPWVWALSFRVLTPEARAADAKGRA